MSARGQPAVAALLERTFDDALGGSAVDAVKGRDGAVRPAQPLGALGEASERPRRRLGVEEGGDTRLLAAKHRWYALGAQHDREDRLLGRSLACRTVDRLRHLVGGRGHRAGRRGRWPRRPADPPGAGATPTRTSPRWRRRACRPGCRHWPQRDSSSASAVRVSSREVGQVQPSRFARVGAEDSETTGVRQHRDAASVQLRLVGEQRRDVDQLLERGGANDAGLVEERIDCDLGAGQRCGVRARCPLSGCSSFRS